MICFDSIIFGLQKFGGITNYWDRLIHHASCHEELSCEYLLPGFIKSADIHLRDLKGRINREKKPTVFSRYSKAHVSWDINTFHSSYYRTPKKIVDRYIITLYDFTYENYFSGLSKYIHSMQKFHSIKAADSIICISESTKIDLLKYAPKTDEKKISVIHLGVDPNIFYPEFSSVEEKDRKLVLFVGGRQLYKRFDLAIEAVERIKDLKLGIVGSHLSHNEKQILTRRLGNRWTEFGFVENKRLRQLYNTSYAFLFPSDCEGFGFPVLEAMASGCPVIASSRKSLPEIGGDAALYAPEQSGESYAACLLKLDSSITRNDLINRGFKRIGKFSWDECMNRTLELY